MALTFREYTASDDLGACVPVLRILRPHLAPDDAIVAMRLRRQMRDGYRLAALVRDGTPVAVIGFRRMDNLVFGEFLYVDDLVVAPGDRAKGHARKLLAAVGELSRDAALDIVVLDTALSNEAAIRLYESEGFERVAYRLVQRRG